MKLTSKAKPQRSNQREPAALKEDFLRAVENRDHARRKLQGAEMKLRTVQAQRRILRPNL